MEGWGSKDHHQLLKQYKCQGKNLGRGKSELKGQYDREGWGNKDHHRLQSSINVRKKPREGKSEL